MAMTIASEPHGFEYLMTFYDHASGFIDVRFLMDKQPSSALAGLKSFVSDYSQELRLAGGLTQWHTDNGEEFTSNNIEEFCVELCSRRTTTTPYHPEQNYGAERANGIILRQVRIILAAGNLHDELWPFAAKYIAMVHRCLPSAPLNYQMSAFEFIYHKQPCLDIFHVFGCMSWRQQHVVACAHVGLDCVSCRAWDQCALCCLLMTIMSTDLSVSDLF